jgi:hypothetical protein
MYNCLRWRPISIAVVLFLLVLPLHCQDEDEETSNNQLMFVPPPAEGVISLGVYDTRGKLVRILKRGASIDSFKQGLNGLFIDWDKTDAQGKPVPNGKYVARGVLVGDVKIAGVAFHLNDWVGDSNTPRPHRILSAALLAGARPALLGETPQQEYVIVENGGRQTKSVPIAFKAQSIKPTGTNLLVFDRSQLALVAPDAGTQTLAQKFSEIRDADAFGDRILVLSGSQIQYEIAGNLQDVHTPVENLFRCAVLGSSIVVATKESKVYKLEGQEFAVTGLGESGELLDLSAGIGDTVWLLVKTDAASLLKQIDLIGQNLREIELPPELRTVSRIAASRDQDALLLISETGDTQRVVGVRFQAANPEKSVWEKWLDRGLTSFRFFDLKEGKVIPSDAKTDSPPVFVRPANNPMETTRQANLQLIVTAEEEGAWTATVDGLPLFQVCKTRNIKQAQWISDGANGMRVYVSDGNVVEEYHLTSLENLFRFDAGGFD